MCGIAASGLLKFNKSLATVITNNARMVLMGDKSPTDK